MVARGSAIVGGERSVAVSGGQSQLRSLSVPTYRTIAGAVPWLILAGFGYWLIVNVPPGDTRAYYDATLDAPYRGMVGGSGAFLYSPAFLQALTPFQLLPFSVFRDLWLVASLLALAWMVGPVLAVALLIPGQWSPVFTDVWFGNINIFTAAILCAGFRWPLVWSSLPFGKLAPGIVLVWPAVRRGWQPLLLAGVILAVSVAMNPADWLAWAGLLAGNLGSQAPGVALLWPRVMVAGGLVLIGAWRGWRWTLVLAVLLAQPVIWYSSLTILFAWIWLLRDRASARRRTERESQSPGFLAAEREPRSKPAVSPA
jgi:hypothetical protein